METFEPVIVAFCCHYCAYTAADMAGSMRLEYPSNVKIIRVPCTRQGGYHPSASRRCRKGADGVIRGRLPGGRLPFQERQRQGRPPWPQAKRCWRISASAAERVAMYTMSAGMGARFRQDRHGIHRKNSGAGAQSGQAAGRRRCRCTPAYVKESNDNDYC
jgi:F420-non-reducing hydrogenase iron-sulfur subunit